MRTRGKTARPEPADDTQSMADILGHHVNRLRDRQTVVLFLEQGAGGRRTPGHDDIGAQAQPLSLT